MFTKVRDFSGIMTIITICELHSQRKTFHSPMVGMLQFYPFPVQAGVSWKVSAACLETNCEHMCFSTEFFHTCDSVFAWLSLAFS
jgi:hypothetical protein